ncbi:MAG: Ig-like domain-containing protein [Gammaproteobacteria bacterium]|jgi:hypothetical protein
MKKFDLGKYTLFGMIAIFLSGCQDGDPAALNQAFTLADLNIVSIAVEPANGTIQAGLDYPFTATGTRPDGSTVDVTDSVTWSSSNTAAAAVNSSGLVVTTATGGVTTITATLASVTGSTQLTVSTEALSSIRIIPDPAAVSACGQRQLEVLGTYNNDGERTIIPLTRFVSWSVTSGNGSIDSQGVLTARTDSGTIDVSADFDGQSGALGVSVTSDLTSIALSPTSGAVDVDGNLQFTATGTYSDSSTDNITQRVDWSSSDSLIATINSSGRATGVSAGPVDITATCGSITSSAARLTVSDEVLDYLRFQDINDANVKIISINVDDIVEIDLEAFFTNGTHRTVTESAQWSSLDNTGNIAIVDNSSGDKGIITALSSGRALIEATYNNREKVLIVNVSQ